MSLRKQTRHFKFITFYYSFFERNHNQKSYFVIIFKNVQTDVSKRSFMGSYV